MTVAACRESILGNSQDAKPTTRTATRNGKTYEQKTENIGKTKKPAPDSTPKEPEYNPEDDELASLSETVRSLSSENDALKDRLAAEVFPASEEEKTAAIDTIKSLRKEVGRLEIELRAVVSSRDSYQRENGELKIQCAMQRKQIAGMGKKAS